MKRPHCLRTVCFDLFDCGNLKMAQIFSLLLALSSTPISSCTPPLASLSLTQPRACLFTLFSQRLEVSAGLQVAQRFSPHRRGSCFLYLYSHPDSPASVPLSGSLAPPPPAPAPLSVSRAMRSGDLVLTLPASFTHQLRGCVTGAKSLSLSGPQFPASQQRQGYRFTLREIIIF